jgi:hypothetical protein
VNWELAGQLLPLVLFALLWLRKRRDRRRVAPARAAKRPREGEETVVRDYEPIEPR